MADTSLVLDYGPLILATGGVLVWGIGRGWEVWTKRQTDMQVQNNLVRALYAEIDFNQRDMERFLRDSPSAEVIRAAIENNPKLVPHITDARHTEIYRNRVGDIHNISDRILRQTVEFYGLLEKIRVQIEALNYPSFKTLSADGRVNAVDVIRHTAHHTAIRGDTLLAGYDREYPELQLGRLARDISEEPSGMSDEDRAALAADLDRRLSEAKARITR
ncbi:MAG: hypothetical protein ABJL99_09035 [Aliishimia sp.]